MLTLEQILPCLVVFNFSTETSSLTLVVKVSTKDGSLITIDSDETIDRSPKTVTINRDNILIFTVYLATEQSEFAFLGILTIQLKAGINATLLSSLNDLTICIDDIICYDNLLPKLNSLLISHITILIECKENLLLLIKLYISILHWLQCLEYECKQKGYNQHEDDRIDNCIRITICFHFFVLLIYLARFARLLMFD